ncbi:hypothetical protein I3760_08G044200 [Carya illinoinensis]|nr:hypothetical protein I3760_08G044200 [Carya illinoinensis]
MNTAIYIYFCMHDSIVRVKIYEHSISSFSSCFFISIADGSSQYCNFLCMALILMNFTRSRSCSLYFILYRFSCSICMAPSLNRTILSVGLRLIKKRKPITLFGYSN